VHKDVHHEFPIRKPFKSGRNIVAGNEKWI
jgi:hypothetical protein